MKDKIIASYLQDFCLNYGLEMFDEAKAFEYFVNHCVISKHYTDTFEPESVSVGGGGDLGIDGLGILVNDHLVLSKDDVDFFKKNLRRLDVKFIFIQSRTSPSFDVKGIGNFLSGIREFFGETLPPTANEDIRLFHEIGNYIFESSVDMYRNPICRMYYSTTGKWMDDPAMTSRIDQGKKDLEQTSLFSDVEFTVLDGEGLRVFHQELHRKITREIVFEKHAILPHITGVQEAYIGIVPCLEYMKLICNDEGTLDRRLFYDNVRDFQGRNAVNREIEITIKDTKESDRFALLNNGVTIVARDVNKVGATFRLEDYQIVNGCQTSHVLYLNKEHLNENVFLPLKLIVTDDTDVTNHIIQGTNRQTEVQLEALESLNPFQKELEEFYTAMGRNQNDPLYYERRSKQYDHLKIRRNRIITLATQLNCFVGMLLNEPHSTHRYYGEVLRSYRSRIFRAPHSPMPYFTSAMALVSLEQLFARGILPRMWKRRKYQILMVFRIQNEPFDLPHLNSKDIDKYCEDLLRIVEDDVLCGDAFSRAGDLVERTSKKSVRSRDPLERTKAFTVALTEAVGKGDPLTAASSRLSGYVKNFSNTLGYGFIQGKDKQDYFVHYSNILGTGFRSLNENDGVEFTVQETPRGLQAIDVQTT